MRFHIRAMYEDGTPVIVKQEADDIFDAITMAGKQVRSNPQVNVRGLQTLRVRPLTSKSSSVYIGQKPSNKGKPRKGKNGNGAAPAAETAPATPATPVAVKAPADAGKPATEKVKAGK